MWSIGVLTGTTSYKGQFRSVRSCRTFEPAMLKGHGTMDNAREHHAGRAARTARALDGCEGWTGGKISSWHDTSLHLGGSVQPSLSPIDAYAWAVIEPALRLRVPGSVVNIAHFPEFNRSRRELTREPSANFRLGVPLSTQECMITFYAC